MNYRLESMLYVALACMQGDKQMEERYTINNALQHYDMHGARSRSR